MIFSLSPLHLVRADPDLNPDSGLRQPLEQPPVSGPEVPASVVTSVQPHHRGQSEAVSGESWQLSENLIQDNNAFTEANQGDRLRVWHLMHKLSQSVWQYGHHLESSEQKAEMRHGPGMVRVLRRPHTVTGHEVVIAAEGGPLHAGGPHHHYVAPGAGL